MTPLPFSRCYPSEEREDNVIENPTTSPTRDILAALLRSRGYIHDDARDPDDMHWVGPQLGIRALLQSVAYEMSRDLPGGKTSGWNRYEVAVAARCYPSEVTR